MDVRLTTEQRQLREAAAKLADDLGPGSVADLSDENRIAPSGDNCLVLWRTWFDRLSATVRLREKDLRVVRIARVFEVVIGSRGKLGRRGHALSRAVFAGH